MFLCGKTTYEQITSRIRYVATRHSSVLKMTKLRSFVIIAVANLVISQSCAETNPVGFGNLNTITEEKPNPVDAVIFNNEIIFPDYIRENSNAEEVEDEVIDALLKAFDEMKPDSNTEVAKRFTVDFNGIQVSYPQYLRLVRLQDKVIKLNRSITALHSKYSQTQLNQLPQYHRLMALHRSLQPLLPKGNHGSIGSSYNQMPMDHEDLKKQESIRMKRSPISVDFMGMRVTYPQYLRLVKLQAKVIKLDQLMRRMLTMRSIEELETYPKWHTLVSLHNALKKLLPPEYITSHQTYADVTPMNEYEQVNEDLNDISEPMIKRDDGTVDFNDAITSYPQYVKLTESPKKGLKHDFVPWNLNKGARNDIDLLWKKRNMQKSSKLFPQGQANAQMKYKRGATFDFNGVQVSYPQYLHLMSLQKKVLKLDAAMKKIAENFPQSQLSKMPKWQTLLSLRHSLEKLLPSTHGDGDFNISTSQ